MLSIIIVFPRIEEGNQVRTLLVRNGFDVHAVCTTGAQAISFAGELDAGIVVSGYKLSDMLYRDLNDYLPKGFEMLLVASAARFSEVGGDGIMAVSMPLKTIDLINTLHMMEEAYRQRRRKEKAKPRERSEQDRAIIEKAKLILMQRNKMSEEDAHRYIQKNSMDSGVNLIEMAEMIISMM